MYRSIAHSDHSARLHRSGRSDSAPAGVGFFSKCGALAYHISRASSTGVKSCGTCARSAPVAMQIDTGGRCLDSALEDAPPACEARLDLSDLEDTRCRGGD
jgi:hypothetical protein